MAGGRNDFILVFGSSNKIAEIKGLNCLFKLEYLLNKKKIKEIKGLDQPYYYFNRILPMSLNHSFNNKIT